MPAAARTRVDIDGPWQRVSLRYAWVEAIGTLLFAVVLAAAVAVVLGLIHDWAPFWVAVPAAVLFVGFALIALLSFLRVRTIGYLLRDDDLIVRRGMLFRRFVSVPYGRMQVVDITQGPVERGFQLKTLKFVTAAASSAVTIPGLPGDEAERLRDRLVAVAESRRAGL